MADETDSLAVRLAAGLDFEDGWYAVQTIDERTFAIGEPLYHQQNWSYLLIGDECSLLFDTGSFCRDITPIVERRARGELTVLPSHMHFDHLGNVERFETVAVADLPMLRACVENDRLTPGEDLFLGSYEGNTAPTFTVNRWLAIGEEIDLGGRRFKVLHTPGHSTDSVSLFCAAENRLFAADFIYSGDLYAQVPGADLPEYLHVANGLLDIVDRETEIFGAHGAAGDGEEHAAPLLRRDELEALSATLANIKRDAPAWSDEPQWRVAISERLTLIVGPGAIEAWR